jgi:predicted dehydrogenase
MKNLLLLFLLLPFLSSAQDKAGPVRLAVAGLSHGHNGWILGRKNDEAVELAGIWEPDTALAGQLMRQYHLDPRLYHKDLGQMLEALKPEGVLAYGTTVQHLQVVEACAPRGIHVMVEKPLAFTVTEAEKMAGLSRKYGTLVLTNFETSWYPTTDKVFQLTRDTSYMGRIRKVVVHDGHQGPKEIGVPPYFFDWLTDPARNGGGALTDFGCYGANLMTLLMNGQVPLSVTAITQQLKPAIYPRVDDEATIILAYPTAQCIIQASWNWPFGRKDMEVYGESGYAITFDNSRMKARGRSGTEQEFRLKPEETATYTSPFLYFADVIRGRIKVPPYGDYSLENNLVVARILEAARRSAREGRTVMVK